MIDTGLKDKVVLITGANHGIGAAAEKWGLSPFFLIIQLTLFLLIDIFVLFVYF